VRRTNAKQALSSVKRRPRRFRGAKYVQTGISIERAVNVATVLHDRVKDTATAVSQKASDYATALSDKADAISEQARST
jgi:hypothetical protein